MASGTTPSLPEPPAPDAVVSAQALSRPKSSSSLSSASRSSTPMPSFALRRRWTPSRMPLVSSGWSPGIRATTLPAEGTPFTPGYVARREAWCIRRRQDRTSSPYCKDGSPLPQRRARRHRHLKKSTGRSHTSSQPRRNPDGLIELTNCLLPLKPTLVVLEAPAASIPSQPPEQLAVVNPRHRDFARACGQLAKTDTLDARANALAERMQPEARLIPDGRRGRLLTWSPVDGKWSR